MARTFGFAARGRYYKRRTAKVIQALAGYDEQTGAALVTEDSYPGMVTRWGYQGSRYRRPHDVYLVGGQVCEVHNVATEIGEDGKPRQYAHAWTATADRWVRDRHKAQTIEQGREVLELHVVDGEIVEARDEGGRNVIEGMDRDEVLAYLDLL